MVIIFSVIVFNANTMPIYHEDMNHLLKKVKKRYQLKLQSQNNIYPRFENSKY